MKYIVGGIGVVLVVIAIIAIIVALMGGDPDPGVLDERIQLTEHSNGSSGVTITAYGQIVADEDFRAIRITVSQSERILEILHGYNLNVEERVQLPNNQQAYDAFLHALDNVGFAETRIDVAQPEREDGVCPTQRRNVYEIEIDGEQALRTWSSPCSGERGTFGGSRSMVERLFRNQIPDYQDIRRGVQL